MPGKPTIPPETHELIRRMSRERGYTVLEIASVLAVSTYTVRKALDPDFAAREAERHRRMYPRVKARLNADPQYGARRSERYFDCDEYRALARLRMRTIRARKKLAP